MAGDCRVEELDNRLQIVKDAIRGNKPPSLGKEGGPYD